MWVADVIVFIIGVLAVQAAEHRWYIRKPIANTIQILYSTQIVMFYRVLESYYQ